MTPSDPPGQPFDPGQQDPRYGQPRPPQGQYQEPYPPQQPYPGQFPGQVPPYGQQAYPPPGYGPPPRRRRAGRTVLIVLGSAAGLFVMIGVIGAIAGGGHQAAPSAAVAPASSAAASPAAAKTAAAAAPKITYVVTGSPADVTYGPAGSDLAGTVPMRVTRKLGHASYYSIQAQLTGGGSVTVEILVGGKVVSSGHASGDYNIASAEIIQDPFSGKWENVQ